MQKNSNIFPLELSSIKILQTLLFLVLTFFSIGSYAGNTITIQTAQGSVSVESQPKKVAVFDLGVLDDLATLNVATNKIAVTDKLYINTLKKQFGKSPKVGTIFTPDIEKLITYKPDLIIIAGRSAKHYKKLKSIAPTIDLTIRNKNFIQGSKSRFTTLGKVFGKQKQAKQVLTRLDTKIKRTKSVTKNKGKALFVLTTGNKMASFGKDSRFGWLFKDLGIKEAVRVSSKENHGKPISFEFIKKAQPDYLLVFDRGTAIGKTGKSAQQVLNNALVRQTPAWKKQRVVYLDPKIYLAMGSISSLEKTAEQISTTFSK